MSAGACSYIFSAQSAAVNIGWVTPSPKCLCWQYILTYGISFYFSSFHFPLRNTQKDLGETAKTTKNDTSRTRTDASEESRFLIYRLRPLGHSVLMVHEVDKLIS